MDYMGTKEQYEDGSAEGATITREAKEFLIRVLGPVRFHSLHFQANKIDLPLAKKFAAWWCKYKHLLDAT